MVARNRSGWRRDAGFEEREARRGTPIAAAGMMVLAFAAGCGGRARGEAHDPCPTEVSLAALGEVTIGWRDVRQVQTQVRTVGGSVSDRDALIDVLWQELSRQDQGLPGGAEIFKSRRLVVRRYRNGHDGPGGDKPAFVRGEVPREAVLTECGRTLLDSEGLGRR